MRGERGFAWMQKDLPIICEGMELKQNVLVMEGAGFEGHDWWSRSSGKILNYTRARESRCMGKAEERIKLAKLSNYLFCTAPNMHCTPKTTGNVKENVKKNIKYWNHMYYVHRSRAIKGWLRLLRCERTNINLTTAPDKSLFSIHKQTYIIRLTSMGTSKLWLWKL